MSVLLSLVAAAAYGLADFNGGLVSQRASAWSVALTAQLGGGALVLLVVPFVGGSPTHDDLVWSVVAGVGNGLGTAFLYRGLSSGRMGVVAPVSGVGAVLVPVVVGLVTGERPGPVTGLGIALALPAIWLVARESGEAAAPSSPRSSGAVDGLLAGLGFGTLFAALAQVSEGAGLLPLALNQLLAGVVIVGVALLLRVPWVPSTRWAWAGVVSGVLGATATGLFQVATRGGHLTVAAVITSLYPAVTVLLAATLLRERVHPLQAAGLALCATAVVLVATG
ncbi:MULTISPECIES: DMT family transporter [unclassified Nocardioides]|uniref:DMT family transporter n=1 Tax=unclassified Nocardioides TaxID=2615069 RepID=UPI00301451DE